VLLHLMAGSKEDSETVTAFFEDMKGRGINDPLLVTSDGAPGIIKAIEVCFPRAARQRCLAHRMRNLAVKVPEDVWPEFKVRVQAAEPRDRVAADTHCRRGDYVLARGDGSALGPLRRDGVLRNDPGGSCRVLRLTECLS
jgi:hypothetical protein